MLKRISGFLWNAGWSIRFFFFEKFQRVLNWRRTENSPKENAQVSYDPIYDEEGYDPLFERNILVFLVLSTLAVFVIFTALAAVFYRSIFGWGWMWAIGVGAITVAVLLVIYDWYYEQRIQTERRLMDKLAPSNASHDEVYFP